MTSKGLHATSTNVTVPVGWSLDQLAVLSQDVVTAPAQAPPATKSLLTVVEGQIVFEDSGMAAAAYGK
jgi:hypothetical protein